MEVDSDGMLDLDVIVQEMKERFDLRIRKWRKTMSGCAWRVYYPDGTAVNWVEAPYPKTPISLAIFLHEVGHHAIGFHRYKKRCEEEYHAWQWAIAEMGRLGVAIDNKVQDRFERSMQYAVGKALRRGIKTLPEPLLQFTQAA
ncbi:MAG TPA: hypothetical protein VIL86_18600 [Tepidisphaeraceae bacterium]|jgi:hypothetical protein